MSPETKVRTRVHSDHYGAIYRTATGYLVEYRDVKSQDTGETSSADTLAHAKQLLRDFTETAKRIGAAKETVSRWRRAARAQYKKGHACNSGL